MSLMIFHKHYFNGYIVDGKPMALFYIALLLYFYKQHYNKYILAEDADLGLFSLINSERGNSGALGHIIFFHFLKLTVYCPESVFENSLFFQIFSSTVVIFWLS